MYILVFSGNSKVWNGKVNILLKTGIVKVNLEKDWEDMSFEEKSDHFDKVMMIPVLYNLVA